MEQTTFEAIDKKKKKAESDASKSQWKEVAFVIAKDMGIAFFTGALMSAGGFAFGKLVQRSGKQSDAVQLRKVV